MSKDVVSVDQYSFKGTDYVTIRTQDGWIYRFQRPESHQPYVFDRKQAPSGRFSDHDTRTPKKVVAYMERRFDCAQLHPEKLKSVDTWNQAASEAN